MNSLPESPVSGHAKRIAPSTGFATGLVVPLALGAPGNLDPGFSDHGRLFPVSDFGGEARSIEVLDEGGLFVAGGDVDVQCSYWFYDCEFIGTNFASKLTENGEVDGSFAAVRPANIEVRDATRQLDGKFVMVGRRIDRGSLALTQFVAYRLDVGGHLDTSFGVDGVFELPANSHGDHNSATAVIVDSDGRIVVSGSRDEELIVLRLLADGSLDESFADAGIFIGPAHAYDSSAYIEMTAGGGYRVTNNGPPGCQVVGLTPDGASDDTFGTAGVAAVMTPQGQAYNCSAMASQGDGTLVLTGSAGDGPFAARLLATGAPDPAFLADGIPAAMIEASAVAVADDGKIIIAGLGEPGTIVGRLESDGSDDTTFGEEGTTLIDLPSDGGALPRVNALSVRTDGSVLATGGDLWFDQPFVVELLGDGGGDSPGVIGIVQPSYFEVAEGDDAVVKVRRTGGSTGDVSVPFTLVTDDSPTATAGEDFANVSGTLSWNSGDASIREITVPILADAGTPEEYEIFRIALGETQGGAGLGTRNAWASILPDGAPAGQFSLEVYNQFAEAGVAEVWVYRNYYSQGAVSVTLTPVSGTAEATSDFEASPITIDWADQDSDAKIVNIALVNDDLEEGAETFTVELSNPTGGAIIGPRASASVTIRASDQPQPPPPRRGGGGAAGILSLLALGIAELIRSLRRSARARI